jgi:hypothetical protein
VTGVGDRRIEAHWFVGAAPHRGRVRLKDVVVDRVVGSRSFWAKGATVFVALDDDVRETNLRG